MPDVTLDHFKRAAADIAAHGDNDTLPFDVDVRFVKDNQDQLSELAFRFSSQIEGMPAQQEIKNAISALEVFSERLLAPTGAAGFRITTKIHSFWNLYFNGLAVAIAERLEPNRSNRVHSYRYTGQGDSLFDRASSWRSFREATIQECAAAGDDAVVVQTDISGFYEHVYHHRIENSLEDLFGNNKVSTEIDRFLNKFAAGRSFGLPVGGQGSRILAELLMSSIDSMLTDRNLIWRRYVDDFVLVTNNQSEAYRALAFLSHALADYGLSLNRTKTTFLTAKHYIDYVRTQLGGDGDDASKLREIDLHFDPYSDTAADDYEELKETVESLEVRTLLALELHKGQPDAFLVAQIGRTLKLHNPEVALQLCQTLLAPKNLHAFRASWSTIMRGIASVRADEAFRDIAEGIDDLLDAIPGHSPHLLLAEASCLHYLRTLRFRRTQDRAKYVLDVFDGTRSQTVRRACIDCWRQWKDRPSFIRVRNQWNSLGTDEQRMLWLSASEFGDDGENFQQQVRHSIAEAWRLGIERQNQRTFANIYKDWCENA